MNQIARSELNITPLASFNPFLNRDETQIVVALINSVEPQVVIEFGCNLGRTARALLDHVPTIKRYIGIDVPWGTQTGLIGQLAEIPAAPGLYAEDDWRFWLLLRNNGTLDLNPQDLELCDACFIDGDHSARVVEHDSYLARTLTRPGGILVWHDYGNEAVEVTQVLDHLVEQEWPLVHVEGTWLAFCRL